MLSMDGIFEDEQEKENLKELYRLIGRLGEMDRAVILLWMDRLAKAQEHDAGDRAEPG